MATNKVVLHGETLIDLTEDTLSHASELKSGIIAHTKTGSKITGVFEEETNKTITANGTHEAPINKYWKKVTVAVPSAPTLQEITITPSAQKQVKTAIDDGCDGYSKVTVEAIETTTPSISSNGHHEPLPGKFFDSVYVNVPQSGIFWTDRPADNLIISARSISGDKALELVCADDENTITQTNIDEFRLGEIGLSEFSVLDIPEFTNPIRITSDHPNFIFARHVHGDGNSDATYSITFNLYVLEPDFENGQIHMTNIRSYDAIDHELLDCHLDDRPAIGKLLDLDQIYGDLVSQGYSNYTHMLVIEIE